MIYLSRSPLGPLSEFVSELRLISGYRPAHELERLLPSKTLELVINLNDGALHCYDPATLEPTGMVRGPMVSGIRSGFSVIDTRQQREILIVQFRPGGARAVLGLPAHEIYDMDLPLESLWGAQALELQHRVLSETDPARRLDVVEKFLTRRIQPGRTLHPLVCLAISRFNHAEEPVRVADLAARAGCSARHFIQVFREHVGVTPKAFACIHRFQTSLSMIPRAKKIDWPDIALMCGYYDQAHLIREFKAFSGITPGAYHEQRGEDANHVPIRKAAGLSAAH